jgi:hypothetical protein
MNQGMKLVANLDGQNERLVEMLRRKGVRAKMLKQSTLIDLPPMFGKGKGKTFRIPREVRNPLLFIDCSESAGVDGDVKHATVVCGLSGKKLHPYFVSERRHGTYIRYARFCVPESLVTVKSTAGKVLITKHQVEEVRAGVVRIYSETMWHGAGDNLPPELGCYSLAADAASAKAASKKPNKLGFAEW